MEEYDRVFPFQVEVNDVIRYKGNDIRVMEIVDDVDIFYIKAENLDTGDVMEDIPLHPDLLVALVTL